MNARERTVSALHSVYKYVLSPVLHAVGGVTGACRFQPTCSQYAAIAISEYGILRGGWMAFLRLLRCQPLCKGGFDPVRPNPHRTCCGNNRYHKTNYQDWNRKAVCQR